MSALQNTGVPFKLTKITTEEYAKFKENYVPSDPLNNVSFDLGLKFNKNKYLIGVITKFVFEQNQRPIFVLACGCHFQIREDFWHANLHENTLLLKKELLTHLIVLTIGTARGIIHAKKPKWAKKLILPTWDVSDIIQEDFQIELINDEEE